MPVFQYTARDQGGQLITETLAFNNEIALRQHLRKANLFVLSVEEHRRGGLSLPWKRRAGLADLIVMVRQLRTMIHAGMPLVSGLEALAEQTPNPRLAEVVAEVARAVGHGRTLAASMGDYPSVFPALMVELVRAGEASGRLPDALTEAGRQLELQMEIRQKLISALVYPAFTLLATVGMLTFMLVYIVPVFADIYRDLKATLPPMTLLLVSVSNVVLYQGWIVPTLLLGAWYGSRAYRKTEEGRLRMDALKLRLPLFGALFLKSASANLTGSLAGLLQSGVPLVQALDTSAGVAGNMVLSEAARNAAGGVVLGRRLSDELELSGVFPTMVVRMIAVAEDVGNLPSVLGEVADSYRQEVEYTIRRIMMLVEPIMILLVAGIVGFVLVALYYPIFNMGNVFLEGA